jgi:hypothetical protein
VPRHVNFLDLLHVERDASRDYNAKRMAQLREWLAALSVAPNLHLLPREGGGLGPSHVVA